MATFKDFVTHPVQTSRKIRDEQRKEKEQNNLSAIKSRRNFIKLGAAGLAGLGAVILLTKCNLFPSAPTGPVPGFVAVPLDGKSELTASIGTAITVDKVTFRVSALSTPAFKSEPREATVEILKSDSSVAYTTHMRKGEMTDEFYNPQDTSKTFSYKLECIEIPSPVPSPDWAKFKLWKKEA